MASGNRKPSDADEQDLHDHIGFWSELKLEIIREYLPAYTKILNRQSPRFKTLYVDAFAGSGHHISRDTGELVDGSPSIALNTSPSFDEYHFIDLDRAKVRSLERLATERPDVTVHHGDCNAVLAAKVFPRAKYTDYRRAVCLLDPYNLQLDWDVVAEAGKMRSVEIFLNFPMLAIHRNVLRHDPGRVTARNAERMTRFWGSDEWRNAGYRAERDLFGQTQVKVEGRELAGAFRERLKSTAGFGFVPKPMTMRNRTGGVIYYLFFASDNNTGGKIVSQIFEKFRKKGFR